MHMYTKYEVFMSNPMAGEVCTDAADANYDDGQFMIVLGRLVHKPNEPKTTVIDVWLHTI